MRFVDSLLWDLRHAVRSFRRSPTFTAAAVAALALGIGANTAVFSVVNAVLLKPVAAPDPDRLVIFMNTSPNGSGPAASPAKFQHWREQTAVVLRNLEAVLAGAGARIEHVTKCTVFLVDLGDFPAMNEVYARTFVTDAPARSTIGVAALPLGARVEIEAIAVIPEG